jgi:hypothetical protein
MPKRLVISFVVVAAVIVLYVVWLGMSGTFIMHRLVLERERQLLYDIDHKTLASELRKFANEQRWGRSIRNADPDAFGMSNPTTPASLRILKPSAIWIFDDRIQFDCGGPFFDFGVVVFPEGQEGTGAKRLADGVWFYSEDGRVPHE